MLLKKTSFAHLFSFLPIISCEKSRTTDKTDKTDKQPDSTARLKSFSSSGGFSGSYQAIIAESKIRVIRPKEMLDSAISWKDALNEDIAPSIVT